MRLERASFSMEVHCIQNKNWAGHPGTMTQCLYEFLPRSCTILRVVLVEEASTYHGTFFVVFFSPIKPIIIRQN